MNVSFYTLGCKLNYAETSQLQHVFERAGHAIVPFGEPSDAVIINTCTVTENADKECRQIIRRALRRSPNAFVGVTGCYAQLQPEEIASIDGVDAVFGAKEKFHIPHLVESVAGGFRKFTTPQCFVSDIASATEFVEAHSTETDSRTRAFLKLQDGCDYKCSFCTIPLARGKSRAMEFHGIPQKIRDLERAGYHEVVLTGINLGDYQASTGEEFTDVVRAINALKPNLRVRISSIEPNLLTDEIIDIVAHSSTFCPSFHIPLQSGSPEILRLMRRRYKAEQYADLVRRIKSAMPLAAIGADVIVGFPTEQDEHFEETYTLLHELPVSYLHVFSYSERADTPAVELSRSGGVLPHKRAERSHRLRMLSAKKKFAFYHAQISDSTEARERIVIPEYHNPDTGRWVGWTENYVRTEFFAPASLLQLPVRVRLSPETDGEIVIADFLGYAEQSLGQTQFEQAHEQARRGSAAVLGGITPTYIPIMLS